MIKRYVDEVVLCFDSDTAGQKAAVRVEESLLASKLGIRVATVPSPHDPDSYVKEFGGTGFQKLITDARDFFDFYLDYLCASQEPNTEKGQLAVVREMGAMINKSGDRLLADKYAQKTAFKLSTFMQLPVSPEAIRAEFQKIRPKRPNLEADAGSPPDPAADEPKPSEREFWLLRFILASDDHLDWLVRTLDPAWIEHPTIRQIVARRCEFHVSQSWQGVPGLLQALDSPAAQQWITRAVAEQISVDSLARNLTETVLRVRNDFIERELKLLTHRRGQPNIPEAEAVEIESRKIELRRLKVQPIGDDVAVG
jgi:DNA primase